MSADLFAMVRRDALWVRGVLTESRSSQGQATERGREIVARNVIDDAATARALEKACDAEMARVRQAIMPLRDVRVRGMVTALPGEIESTITITLRDVSVVTTVEHLLTDYRVLKRLSAAGRMARSSGVTLPILWRNGSGAVLLHEAVGHAAEHGHAAIDWPPWLRVTDRARNGRVADLLAGEMPPAVRRESFRDVPLPRMTELVVEQQQAPFDMPEERLEVHLVAGGAYEPLTQTVSIHVAVAEEVRGGRKRRVAPFSIRASRLDVARAMRGATGDPLRYPGVICSREGQELFVRSAAPLMITAELA